MDDSMNASTVSDF